MPHGLTRREALRVLGTAGASVFVLAGPVKLLAAGAGAGETIPASQNPDLVQIGTGRMLVTLNRKTGTVHSIKEKDDPLDTDFLGNPANTGNAGQVGGFWTGAIVSATWEPGVGTARGRWHRELTDSSADIRKVDFDGKTMSVKYTGKSENELGLKSYNLVMSFAMADDSSLHWDIEVENTTGGVLEIGEFAFPLRANDDYQEAYRGTSVGDAIQRGNVPMMQKLIHEKKVFAHHFIAGHSSYALIQRPAGNGPFLLFHTLEDTPLECIYKSNPNPRTVTTAGIDEPQGWIGTDLLAIHSRATEFMRRWWNNPWVNGHSSLILQPGQKKSWKFRFSFINDYPDIREELNKAGNLGIRILPAMVVPENIDVYTELKCKADLDSIETHHSDGITVKDRKRSGDKTLLTFSFNHRGQKSVKLNYGGGRWTYLHFYCIEDLEQLVKARGRFIAEREFYENPTDPYNRNHMFLPFDYRRGTRYADDDEAWQVGGSDEPGFSEPVFLAEKNVYFPSKDEIRKLELYVSDCLFKYIQNPETYEVRASLYFKDREPSSPWGNWSKRRSESTGRAYNYVHAANIYHALYRIGKEYGLATHRPPAEYLKMAARTSTKWFSTGSYRHVGLMCGSNALNILQDLKAEGIQKEYDDLFAEVKNCNDIFIRDPYPYSSEMALDETAQEQVYYFTREFGLRGDQASREKNLKTVKVLEALRGGNQPVWFRYGQDLFAHPGNLGNVTCWYSESLNGLPLLQAYEDLGDPELLLKGYPGVWSVMRNVLADGMGFGWFIMAPGIFAHEPAKTFESGQGLWGFLRATKAYIVNDESFGLIGCGCRIEPTRTEIKVTPHDGVKKRVRFVTEKIDIATAQGEINSLTLKKSDRSLELHIGDSTGLAKSARVTVKGLRDGEYRVKDARISARIKAAGGVLEFAVPIKDASMIAISRA